MRRLVLLAMAALTLALGTATAAYSGQSRATKQDSSPAASRQQAVAGLLAAAATHVERHELEQAAALLERALRIDSQDATVWRSLAEVKWLQGEPNQAEALAAKADELAQKAAPAPKPAVTPTPRVAAKPMAKPKPAPKPTPQRTVKPTPRPVAPVEPPLAEAAPAVTEASADDPYLHWQQLPLPAAPSGRVGYPSAQQHRLERDFMRALGRFGLIAGKKL